MAYKLKTARGRAISGTRKSTVEPVIGMIKALLGFRQFSLRVRVAAAGEWCLVCLAFNCTRLHTLSRIHTAIGSAATVSMTPMSPFARTTASANGRIQPPHQRSSVLADKLLAACLRTELLYLYDSRC